jgi:hypothetical protein
MRAPPDDMPRDRDAILAAVKLINPPPDSEELFRATLETAISNVRYNYEMTANLPSPRKMRYRAESYLTALLVAKKRAKAVAPFYWSKAFDGRSRPDDDRADRVPPPPYNFVEALDREIREVKDRVNFPVPHGAQPRDLTAAMSAAAARDFLKICFIFPKDRDGKDLPAVKNPWQQDAPLTEGGVWPELSALIYKAVTGRGRNMMPVCRQAGKVLPRLPYSSTPHPRPKTRRSTAARR